MEKDYAYNENILEKYLRTYLEYVGALWRLL
jgi:hypothetical protein